MEGIRKAMNERNLSEGQWEDREQCSLDVGQRRKHFETDVWMDIAILTKLKILEFAFHRT
jgi:hypothetical protein